MATNSFFQEQMIFGASPMFYQLDNVKIGLKVRFNITARDTSGDIVLSETTYRYANTAATIRFDVSPFIQRAFAKSFAPAYVASSEVNDYFKYNRLWIEFDNVEWIRNDTGQEVVSGEFEFLCVYGHIPAEKLHIQDEYDLRYDSGPGGRFLTKATIINVYENLPHTLNSFTTESDGAPFVLENLRSGEVMGFDVGEEGSLYVRNLIKDLYPNYNDVPNGDWIIRKDSTSPPEIYHINFNCAVDYQLLRDKQKIYLRWLNSLGGMSYALLDVKNASDTISENYIDTNIDTLLPEQGVIPGDTMVLSKESRPQLEAGKGFLTRSEIEDLRDLSKSINVSYYDPDTDAFIECRVSGRSGLSPSSAYNDFSCTIIFSRDFSQTK